MHKDIPLTSRPEDRYPCSLAQQRLWFVDQYEPGTDLYNISMAWELRGLPDQATLQSAIDALVIRHETLRTRFDAFDGVPVQVIESHAGVPAIVRRRRSVPTR